MLGTALALPPPLFEGDRLDTAEFLRRWEALPELQRAELIDGIVFMPSPVSLPHGTVQFDLITWIGNYKNRTPGCQAGTECTWVMGPKDVPQPDLFLRILPEWGGQSKNAARYDGRYGAGAPELIVEVILSSRSRDFGIKQELYRRADVREYLTVELFPQKIVWRRLVQGSYRNVRPGRDGIIRSHCFPGLWLDPNALWEGRLIEFAGKGLESPQHAAFVRRLKAARPCK